MSEVPARRSPHRPGIQRRAVERPPAPYSRYGWRGPRMTEEQTQAGADEYLRARRERKRKEGRR